MVNVVYNACYGGFGLSREAILLGRQLSGDPRWANSLIEGDLLENGKVNKTNYSSVEIDRTDPILIKVIETLGQNANGPCAKLRIEELREGTAYRIDEHDGYERVMTADDYDWKIA